MKIVILYSPSSCFTPEFLYFFCWTQKKIFWRMLVIKQLAAIDIKWKYNCGQWLQSTVPLPVFSKDHLLSFEKNWIEKTWGVNDDTMYIFGWTITFTHHWHLVHAVYTWLGVTVCFVECHLGSLWTNEIVQFVTKNMILSHSQQRTVPRCSIFFLSL